MIGVYAAVAVASEMVFASGDSSFDDMLVLLMPNLHAMAVPSDQASLVQAIPEGQRTSTCVVCSGNSWFNQRSVLQTSASWCVTSCCSCLYPQAAVTRVCFSTGSGFRLASRSSVAAKTSFCRAPWSGLRFFLHSAFFTPRSDDTTVLTAPLWFSVAPCVATVADDDPPPSENEGKAPSLCPPVDKQGRVHSPVPVPLHLEQGRVPPKTYAFEDFDDDDPRTDNHCLLDHFNEDPGELVAYKLTRHERGLSVVVQPNNCVHLYLTAL